MLLLITERMVVDAMRLDANEVTEALNRNPMTRPPMPVATAEFEGMTFGGKFTYTCVYVEDGEVVHRDVVSLQYKRSAMSTGYLLFGCN